MIIFFKSLWNLLLLLLFLNNSPTRGRWTEFLLWIKIYSFTLSILSPTCKGVWKLLLWHWVCKKEENTHTHPYTSLLAMFFNKRSAPDFPHQTGFGGGNFLRARWRGSSIGILPQRWSFLASTVLLFCFFPWIHMHVYVQWGGG